MDRVPCYECTKVTVENYGPLEQKCFDNIFFKRIVVFILEIQGEATAILRSCRGT
jgi:hypothetical protein